MFKIALPAAAAAMTVASMPLFAQVPQNRSRPSQTAHVESRLEVRDDNPRGLMRPTAVDGVRYPYDPAFDRLSAPSPSRTGLRPVAATHPATSGGHQASKVVELDRAMVREGLRSVDGTEQRPGQADGDGEVARHLPPRHWEIHAMDPTEPRPARPTDRPPRFVDGIRYPYDPAFD